MLLTGRSWYSMLWRLVCAVNWKIMVFDVMEVSVCCYLTFDTFDEFVDPPLGHLLRPPLQSCDCFIYTPIQQ